jgi:hypothetical protein
MFRPAARRVVLLTTKHVATLKGSGNGLAHKLRTVIANLNLGREEQPRKNWRNRKKTFDSYPGIRLLY